MLLNCEYDEKSDIFSAGCTIFELLTGYFLFQTTNYGKGEKEEAKRDKEQLELIVKTVGNRGLDKLLKKADKEKLALIESFGHIQT